MRRRSGWIRNRRTLWVFCAIWLLLATTACGSEPATITADLIPPTATVAPTATPVPPTATRPPVPTATSVVLPTATLMPSPTRPLLSPTPAGGYRSDWLTWRQGEEAANKLRYSYDSAENEYHVAVLEADQEWSFYAPEGLTFQDFVLDIDARRISGADAVGYGLVFRRQPKGDQKASARYIFYVTAQGRFSFFQVNTDNTSKTLRTLDAPSQAGVIKVGGEPNHLRVTAKGSEVTLAVNGTTVYTLKNATITQAGEIGIFAKTPEGVSQMEIAFKNLVLTPNP